MERKDTERAAASGAAAWKRLDKDEVENRRRDRQARKEMLTASVGQRWDGGDRSAIAPMKVYTPTGNREPSRPPRHLALNSARSTVTTASRARVRNAPAPSGPKSTDRYA